MSPNTSRGGLASWVCLFSLCTAALGVALAWGFTVDDAWISARVAWRLRHGFGYRFNAGGPIVDAVTPLGWAWVLVPFAGSSIAGALTAARILGSLSWVLAAGWFGHRLQTRGKSPYFVVPLLASAPLGAWASSGMETGLVLALATISVTESLTGAVAASIVASWRPEMIPFCVVLALRGLAMPQVSAVRRWLPLLLAILLPGTVVAIRYLAFGRPYPLAVLAKPSDLGHGLRYGIGATLFLGPTWLLAGGGWRSLTKSEHLLAAAVAVHALAMVVAGGDWMPLWRLAVPAVPAALWVSACLQSRQRLWTTRLRFGAAALVTIIIWYYVGLPARKVMQAREWLIERGHGALIGARKVASLDVGWLGAAFSGEILDLAGVTDARVARLPGGHTTKKIPNSWFDSTQPDALVLLTAKGEVPREPWTALRYARGIENRIRDMPYFENCRLADSLDLMYTGQSYVVVRCSNDPAATSPGRSLEFAR